MANIGFIGVGNMGGPMAGNLVKAGHAVTAYDVVPALLERVEAAGCAIAASAAEAARGRDAVVTMLPAGEHVRAVYLEADGIIAAAAGSGAVLVDSSTIDVMTAREVIAAASESGLSMVDAPVSGGVGGAEAATLTFMVGGSDKAFAQAKPFLENMGRNIIHAGGPGNGQAAKVCNNMILGITMIGISEAFTLADKLGLDAETLFSISSKASGSCWAMINHCPVPGIVEASAANRNYQPGFSAAMMQKDLKLSQEAAAQAGAPTPLGAQAAALYTMFLAKGHGGVDYSGIIKMLRGEA